MVGGRIPRRVPCAGGPRDAPGCGEKIARPAVERAAVTPTPLRPSFVVVALLAAVAWNLRARSQQAPQTAQRPGETARRSPAATTGAHNNTPLIKGRVVG